MKTKAILLLWALSCTTLLGQVSDLTIKGNVYEKTFGGSKKPVPANASVFIPGLAMASTDELGYYSLDLSDCETCLPGKTVTIKVNSPIGYAEKEYTISTEIETKPVDIEVERNNTLSLSGYVKDKNNGKLLSGIKVKAVLQNSSVIIPSTATDEFGTFNLNINTEGITKLQAINLIMKDGVNNRYKDMEKTVYINQYEPVIIELESIFDQSEPTSKARKLAAQEVHQNILNLEIRLSLFYNALKLSENTNFDTLLGTLRERYPAYANDYNVRMDKLELKTDLASLRHSLNGTPLSEQYTNLYATTFLDAGVNQPLSLFNYLQQIKDVLFMENSILQVMEDISDTNYATSECQLKRWDLNLRAYEKRCNVLFILAQMLLREWEFPLGNHSEDMFSNFKYLHYNRSASNGQLEKEALTLRQEVLEIFTKGKSMLNDCKEELNKTTIEGIEKIDSMLKIYPSDPPEVVVGKCVSLRQFGRKKDAQDGFRTYKAMFLGSDKNAEIYSDMAIRLTEYMNDLNLNGGMMIYDLTEGGNLQKALVPEFSILIGINGTPTTYFDELKDALANLPDGTVFKIQTLWWDASQEKFQKKEYTMNGKPLGAYFVRL